MGIVQSLDHRLVRPTAPLVICVSLALLTYGRVAELRPFGLDSLGPLSWAFRANALSFIKGNVAAHPEWRPLPYLTFWLQYQLTGLEQIGAWFVVNVILWGLCAYLVYLIVSLLGRSRLAGLLTAGVVLLEPRPLEQLLIITGRQMVFACLFGLSALLLVLSSASERWLWPTRIALFLLLLLAALSKEPGLAFAPTVVGLVLLSRHRDWRALTLAGLAALAGYFLLRFFLVGGTARDYCQDVGFFSVMRHVCYGELAWSERLVLYVYNMVAMLVGTLFQGVYGSKGRLDPTLALLLPSIPWFLLAAVGWARLPRQTLPLLLLVLVGAAVSFSVYRPRNQIYGMLALYLSAGVGLAHLLTLTRRRAATRAIALAALPLLVGWLGLQALRAEAGVRREVAVMQATDPCETAGSKSEFERRVVVELKRKYGLPRPSCT